MLRTGFFMPTPLLVNLQRPLSTTITAETLVMTATTKIRRDILKMGMVRRRSTHHKIVCIAAAAAFSTSPAATYAWSSLGSNQRIHPRQNHLHEMIVNGVSPPRCSKQAATATRLYSSSKLRNRFRKSDDDDDNSRKELFGFRKSAERIHTKAIPFIFNLFQPAMHLQYTNNAPIFNFIGRTARKILPTKWFGTKEEKEALERKQLVKSRVQGELDQMLKGAPLPIKIFAKYVAAPMMGKIASTVAEAGRQQQETMEAILDEARELLLNDSEIVGLLGTPIQIGMPFSQMSSTTVINGRRQMRSEFSVEISGPIGNGVSRIVASNEGIGQLLFESNGKMYNVDLSSRGRMKSASPTKRSRPKSSGKYSGNDDDNIIEAEIIDKETK